MRPLHADSRARPAVRNKQACCDANGYGCAEGRRCVEDLSVVCPGSMQRDMRLTVFPTAISSYSLKSQVTVWCQTVQRTKCALNREKGS